MNKTEQPLKGAAALALAPGSYTQTLDKAFKGQTV
jgi:hypothetical protein